MVNNSYQKPFNPMPSTHSFENVDEERGRRLAKNAVFSPQRTSAVKTTAAVLNPVGIVRVSDSNALRSV